MDIIDFYRVEQKRLHEWLWQAVNELSSEEWHHLGPGNVNSVAFLLWHCARTEDNILRFILQGRPPIWNEGKWYERLSLPPRLQGTGWTHEEARAFHINDIPLFKQYVEEVWREFEEYLAGISDGGAALGERMVTVKPLGEMPALQAIGQVCITHCFIHLGEIAYILGVLGKSGLPI
jgi:uncharacterized damage-inducible protein DinB